MRYVLLFFSARELIGALEVKSRADADEVIAKDAEAGFRSDGDYIEIWSRAANATGMKFVIRK